MLIPLRDPFSHLVAYFFQVPDERLGETLYQQCLVNDRHISSATAAELREKFNQFMRFQLKQAEDNPERSILGKVWVDVVVSQYFGLDISEVFEKSDLSRGYIQIDPEHLPNVSLLFMQYDLADAVKENVIGDFLALPQFKIKTRCNVGEKKVTKHLYRYFKEHIKFTQKEYDAVCESRFYNAFYTDEMRRAFAKQWVDKTM